MRPLLLHYFVSSHAIRRLFLFCRIGAPRTWVPWVINCLYCDSDGRSFVRLYIPPLEPLVPTLVLILSLLKSGVP